MIYSIIGLVLINFGSFTYWELWSRHSLLALAILIISDSVGLTIIKAGAES